jgi:hypothetical protein
MIEPEDIFELPVVKSTSPLFPLTAFPVVNAIDPLLCVGNSVLLVTILIPPPLDPWPLLRTTEPPNNDSLAPTLRNIDPRSPSILIPVLTRTEPDEPVVDSPLSKSTAPLEPPLALPVRMFTEPLCTPFSPVFKLRCPLLADSDEPEEITRWPPVAAIEFPA